VLGWLPVPIPNVAILDVSNNLIAELPDFSDHDKLLELDFSGNRIANLPVPVPKTGRGSAHAFPVQLEVLRGAGNQRFYLPDCLNWPDPQIESLLLDWIANETGASLPCTP